MTLHLFKRSLCVLALAAALGAGCHREEPKAAPAATPMAALDGYVWEASDPQSKLDFLLGVECAIAMDAALQQAAHERGGKAELSVFASGWQAAFQDRPRQYIVSGIDEFYSQNPGQKGRHVFDVIWTEMIRPAAGR